MSTEPTIPAPSPEPRKVKIWYAGQQYCVVPAENRNRDDPKDRLGRGSLAGVYALCREKGWQVVEAVEPEPVYPMTDAERDEGIREAHRLIQDLQRRVHELEAESQRRSDYEQEQLEHQG